jgi:hypothetical protein
MIHLNKLSPFVVALFIFTHPVSGGKGDQTAQNTENNQSAFSNQLQQVFQANNASQQNQLNFLNTKMQSAINNPQGFNAQTLASMRAQATDQTAAQVQNADRAVNSSFANKGGAAALPNGAESQVEGAIATNAGQQENAAQQNITEQNAQLQNSNEWNAVKGEEGVAGMENPEGMAGEENQSASTVGGLSQAVTSSAGPTFGSILGGVAGAGIGAAGQLFQGKG